MYVKPEPRVKKGPDHTMNGITSRTGYFGIKQKKSRRVGFAN